MIYRALRRESGHAYLGMVPWVAPNNGGNAGSEDHAADCAGLVGGLEHVECALLCVKCFKYIEHVD